MSAIKERKLVWEENGKLKFAKPEPNEYLKQIARASRPLTEEELKRLGDKAERRGQVTGKIACRLPDDYHKQKPHVNYTPADWKRVRIAEDGEKFRLVAMISGVEFTAIDLELGGLDPKLKLRNLTLEQARETGTELNAAMQALFETGGKAPKTKAKKSSKKI